MAMQRIEKKLKEIEALVTADLSNGRHIQKKLQSKLKDNGSCPESLCNEIKKLIPVK